MSIINISKVVDRISGENKNQYTYMRVKNLLNGMPGRSSKKEIKEVKKIIETELTQIIKKLDSISKQTRL